MSLDSYARILNKKFMEHRCLHDTNKKILENSLKMSPKGRYASPLRDSYIKSPLIDYAPVT